MNPMMTKILSLKVVSLASIFLGKYLHHRLMMMNDLKEILLFLEVFIIIFDILFAKILFVLVLQKMMIENCFPLKVRI